MKSATHLWLGLGLGFIVFASGCRTTGKSAIPGFSWLSPRSANQLADASTTDAFAASDLPPPSAAARPGTPLLDKAKTAADKATGQIRGIAGDVQATAKDIAEPKKSYPATAYPNFQASQGNAQTPSPNAGVPYVIPGNQAPPAMNLPIAKQTSATTNIATAGQAVASNASYMTGPYSTSATAIPSQNIQNISAQNSQPAAQQGYYNPQFTPTMSSRRSTLAPTEQQGASTDTTGNANAGWGMPPATGPAATGPPAKGHANMPHPSETQFSNGAQQPATYQQPIVQPQTNQFANAMSAPISTAQNSEVVSPVSYNAAPQTAPSFYTQQNQQQTSSPWRPGSTCQDASCAGDGAGVVQSTGGADPCGPNGCGAPATASAPDTGPRTSVWR